MVSNMEKHYVFKSLFEDNTTQMSSIGGKAHLWTFVAFSRSFARVSYNIHSVDSNHGEEFVAPIEF